MSLSIKPLKEDFAGEVSGVDLRKPLFEAEVEAIEAGMDRYAVLIFHDQRVNDDQQVAFSRNFGEIELAVGGNVTKPENRRLAVELADVSNLAETNDILKPDDRRGLFNLGNQLWHSDSSYRAVPAKYSLLSARRIPKIGGNTEFADMRSAYDALDDETSEEIKDLICEHSLLHSRAILGFTDFTPEDARIADNFAQLAAVALKNSQTLELLQKHQNQLEVLVKKRTAQLDKTIHALRSEIEQRRRAQHTLLDYQQKLRTLASQLTLSEERQRRRDARQHPASGEARRLQSVTRVREDQGTRSRKERNGRLWP